MPTGHMFNQIKEFENHPKRRWTPTGIMMSLQYFHEVLENPVIDGTGIGIVEHFYYKARDYYGNLSVVINHNAATEIDNTEEVIYVKPPKNRKKKLINMEEIK